MRNTFMGLDADEWAKADGLPEWSPMMDGYVAPEDVQRAVVMMLRRLDGSEAEAAGAEHPTPRR